MTDIHVLSGFLGSGKTSLLRHVLKNGADGGTAVLVNEFGQLGLDGRLLEEAGLPLYELNSGCICCTLNGKLSETLGKILHSRNLRHIVIEASGVADPVNIRRALEELPQGAARIAGITTVLDARMWSRRNILGILFTDQLKEANLIVINKTDLLSPQDLEAAAAEVRAQFPQAALVQTEHGRIDPELFWKNTAGTAHKNAFLLPLLNQCMEAEAKREQELKAFCSVSIISKSIFNRAAFEAFLASPPAGLLRAKGRVQFPDEAAYADFVDGAITWSTPPCGLEGTCLAFIGKNLNETELKQRLASCIAAKGKTA